MREIVHVQAGQCGNQVSGGVGAYAGGVSDARLSHAGRVVFLLFFAIFGDL